MKTELREQNIETLKERVFDSLIIGAGINGASSGAALSAQGARVCLIDQGDFGSLTSQESSNLVWGGIKYMENMEFGLVAKLCRSRNQLLRAYPTNVREIRFLTTIERGFRFRPLPLWIGTWLYWAIGRGFTKTPRLLSRGRISQDEPNVRLDNSTGGFEYSDAYLPGNDSRFVFDFVRKTRANGGVTINYLESLESHREKDLWVTKVRDKVTGLNGTIRSRTLINACGPYVDEYNRRSQVTTRHRHLFSKGIHLIVKRCTSGSRSLAFFASDGRLFFVIPMGPMSCLGTTDTRVEEVTDTVTPEDRSFVLDNINRCLALKAPLTEADIISERCGVRPLVVDPAGKNRDKGDWSSLSRKHAIEIDLEKRHLCIFGGKLTDCLNIGDAIVKAIGQMQIGVRLHDDEWFGEPPTSEYESYQRRANELGIDGRTPAHFSEPISHRLWRRYGADAGPMLETVAGDETMSQELIEGSEFLRCEIDRVARDEMVVNLDDFLRRRTKIALTVSKDSLREDPGTREACEALFGSQAQTRFEEYFSPVSASLDEDSGGNGNPSTKSPETPGTARAETVS